MNAASPFTDNLHLLTGTTYTIIQPQNFGSQDLSGFSVIWLDRIQSVSGSFEPRSVAE